MAARFFNQCRSKGVQGSNTDFLLCALSARHDLAIFTIDEDFKHYVEGYFDGKVEVSEHYVFDRTETTEEHIYQHKNLKRQYCGYPSQRLVIDTEGNVFPCCVDFHKTMCLGNIEIDSLLDIWNSIKLKTIRDLLKDGYFPTHTCQNCTSWVAYKHPYSENMKDKEIWAHTMKEISSVI